MTDTVLRSVGMVIGGVISKTPGTSWSGPFRGIKLLASKDNGATWGRVGREGNIRKLGPRDTARNEVNRREMFFLEEFGLPHDKQVAYPFSYVAFVKQGRDNYTDYWTADDPDNLTYQPKLSPKWIRQDGKQMVLIWSDAMKNAKGHSHTVNYRWNQMRMTVKIQ